jgi:hypothetical protein
VAGRAGGTVRSDGFEVGGGSGLGHGLELGAAVSHFLRRDYTTTRKGGGAPLSRREKRPAATEVARAEQRRTRLLCEVVRPLRLLLGVSLLVGPVTACAGLLGVEDLGYGADAGADAVSDASADVTTSRDAVADAPPGVGPDAPPVVTDAAGPFCSRQEAGAAFCDDFDKGAVGVLWPGRVVDDGGSITAAPVSLSPSGAVAFELASSDAATGSTAAYLVKKLPYAPGTVSAIRYELALQLGVMPAPVKDYLFLASLHFDDAACVTSGGLPLRSIQLGIAKNGALETDIKGFRGDCVVGGDFIYQEFVSGLPDLFAADGGPKWTRVAIELSGAPCVTPGSGASLRLAVDGVHVDPCVPLPVAPGSKTQTFEIHLGPATANPHAALRAVYVDDVLVRAN